MENDDIELKKAIKGCSGCLIVFVAIIWGLAIIGSKVDPIVNNPKPTILEEKYVIKFGLLSFDESDLPYLERYIKPYFINIDLDRNYFAYYIDKSIWDSMPYDGKEALMVRSAAYGILTTKQNEKNSSGALARVHILNKNNGEELGSYGFSGYNFK